MKRPAIIYTSLRRSPAERFEALIAAKRANLALILVGATQPDNLKTYLDEFCLCDINDPKACLVALQPLTAHYDIQAAISWTDLGLECAAFLNESLSLPGLSVKLLKILKNKYETRKFLASIENLCPKFTHVTNLEELNDAMDIIGYPAIIKPVGGNGSKGIFRLDKPADLARAMAELQKLISDTKDPIFLQHGPHFIVEQLITGDEVSIEIIVHDHKAHIIGVTDKQTLEPFHLELQHIFPARVSASAYKDIEKKVAQMVELLGCNQCTLHIEGKVQEDQFILIEVNARAGGDYITTHLVPQSTGLDHMVNIIKVATGAAPHLVTQKSHSYAGVRFLLAEKAGIFQGLSGYNKGVLDILGLDQICYELPLGAQITLPPESFTNQRVAVIRAHGPTHEAVTQILLETQNALQIKY